MTILVLLIQWQALVQQHVNLAGLVNFAIMDLQHNNSVPLDISVMELPLNLQCVLEVLMELQ